MVFRLSRSSWTDWIGDRQVILLGNVEGKRAEMTTRSEREKAQKLNEQHQAILSKMLREDDNKYCADCEAKGEMTGSEITS